MIFLIQHWCFKIRYKNFLRLSVMFWVKTVLQAICDYQLSKVQWSFVDEVLDYKLRCCHGQLSLFLMVAISSPTVLCALLPMTSKANKLEQVACDNNTLWTLSLVTKLLSHLAQRIHVDSHEITHNLSAIICCSQLGVIPSQTMQSQH